MRSAAAAGLGRPIAERWYPTARWPARQDAEATSDVTYRWGAMGHDGYQHPDVQTVPPGAGTRTRSGGEGSTRWTPTR